MGRPKGSLNRKYKKAPEKKEKRKRGRPRKAAIVPMPEPESNCKSIKFLGYCPKCKFLISKKELVSKKLFQCPSCEKRARTNRLLKESGSEPLTRKEYLETMVHASSYNDMPALNDHEIDPKDLKIQEL